MKQIFINLPVEDLETSMNFYAQLGFSHEPLFTDDDQKCMVRSEQIYVMLQSKEFSTSYVKKPLSDTKNSVAATFTLPVESFERVNEMIERGLKAGGRESVPILDEGFMQLRTIEDPDGYIRGVMYLGIDQFKKATNR